MTDIYRGDISFILLNFLPFLPAIDMFSIPQHHKLSLPLQLHQIREIRGKVLFVEIILTFNLNSKLQDPLVLTGVGQAMFSLSFSTDVLTVMEEDYVYALDSFIAEFGGALGLFLGFSFLMIWDLIQFGIKSIKYKF